MVEQKKFKILIVDDEFLIRRSLKLAGESRGHIMKEAEDGLFALSLWSSFCPDLAFIDVLMPKMDGLELLKNIPRDSKTKIVIISAHDELSKRDIQNRGVDLFVKKPFNDVFKLIEQAEELIKGSHVMK